MKIDNHTVPADIVQIWKKTVHTFELPTARHLIKELGLGAGFRPNKIDLRHAHQRLCAALEQLPELPEVLRTALKNTTLSHLISPLSETFIHEHQQRFCSAWGHAALMAAFCLDDRSTLRQQGLTHSTTDEPSVQTEEESQNTATTPEHVLQPLRQALDTLLGSAEIPPSPAAAEISSTDPQLEAKCQRLRTELREQQQKTQQLQQEWDRSRRQAEQATAELIRLKPELAQAQHRQQEQSKRLATLEEHHETEIRQRVNALLDARLQPWLASAEQLQHTQAQSGTPKLLEQAKNLLEEQARIDQRFGTRQAVAAELQTCEHTLQRLQEAQRESFRPLTAQLLNMQSRLLQHCQTLRDTLRQTANVSPSSHSTCLTRFAHAVQQCQHLEDIAQVRQQFQISSQLGLLDETEQEQAYALLNESTARLYALESWHHRTAAQEREGLRELPLHAMRTGLAQGQAATLLVDGHNTLFMLHALFRPHFANGQPTEHARHVLTQHLQRLADQHPQLDIHLWFDGPVHSQYRQSDNFMLHYSGGAGENRADERILEFLYHLQKKSPHALRAVVTADRDEAQKASQTGTMVMAPQELALWLK